MLRSILACGLLLALSACGETESLVEGLGDAENATFSSDGRLFVTGGTNAYEVLQTGDSYQARPLYNGTCNFTGVAVRDGVLYTACLLGNALSSQGAFLLAAPLTAQPALKIIHRFGKVSVPNGMAFDKRGRLLVADSAPLAGKIVALTLSTGATPSVTSETVWHQGGYNLVNGLKVFNDKVWVTDLTDIKSVDMGADGSPGTSRLIARRLGVFDDLLVTSRGIVAADYLGGVLAIYSLTGQFLGQSGQLFDSPSSVTLSQGPLVPPDTLVVTEKGAMGEYKSADGNRVSLFLPQL